MRTARMLAVGMLALGVGEAAPASPVAQAAAAASGETSGQGQSQGQVIKVKPGERKGNGDVTVANNSEKADAKIEGPSYPNKTTVTTDKDFTGTISGVDTGDTVDLGASQDDVVINATGGTVLMSKGSNVTVNVAPLNAAAVTVKMPGGGTMTVQPGSSVNLKT